MKENKRKGNKKKRRGEMGKGKKRVEKMSEREMRK